MTRTTSWGAALAVLALLAADPARARANLIVNGGFETGNFSGWTQSGNTGFTGVTTSPVHSGNFAAFFGPIGSLGFLSQTVATTPGDSYAISFWLRNEGGSPNTFQVSFGGTTLLSQTNLPGQPYTQYNFTATATAATSTLQFGFRQDPSFFYLDDVSVESASSAVPAPGGLALLASGGVSLVGTYWRRRRIVAAA